MEIPKKLVKLYKHWARHTRRPEVISSEYDDEIYNGILDFANERMNIFDKKSNGKPKPYTEDKVLNTYRFCNIYRELDRQTIYFHELLKPLLINRPLWLMNMLFCRFICNTETISKTGLLSFEKLNNKEVYHKLLSLPSPKYGNAYIFPISTIQRTDFNTREKFFCFYLPSVTEKLSGVLNSFNNISVADALKEFIPAFGFNFKFHLTELLIDVAYQYPDLIDLYKEFPIGPGSMPTMRMLNINDDPQQVCLKLVHSPIGKFNYLTLRGMPIYLSAENWEGIGCEYRKYTNLLKGSGRKRRFS